MASREIPGILEGAEERGGHVAEWLRSGVGPGLDEGAHDARLVLPLGVVHCSETAGIGGVHVHAVPGELSDHLDPAVVGSHVQRCTFEGAVDAQGGDRVGR